MLKNIVEKILQKTPLTIASATNIRNFALRRCVMDELGKKKYTEESILATPFYEAIFPWETDSRKLKERCEKKEINPIIADLHCRTLSNGKEIDSLYAHQRRAIKAIRNKKSIVVTTGTGSGKTECFMYPIFDRLAEELDKGNKLKGVQALFLYPLNALIQSQGDRFEQFCKKFNEKYETDGVHFANYTGKMKETYSEAISDLHKINPTLSMDKIREMFPENGIECINRETLRKSTPHFLITNSTMLEYALIRKIDNPLFENSDLKFIVLDEAHSYTGSNATELAMRLRRVLLAFGKKPSDVQFIMTSATVGQKNDVKKFLADIAEIDINDVECINGKRIIPDLKPVTGSKFNIETALKELRKTSDDLERFNILCRTDKALKLRSLFISGTGRLSQDALDTYLHLKTSESIEFLDIASSAKNSEDQYFLPLKTHIFQKHFPGIWACCNPNCTGKQKNLQGEDSDWKYGRVYFDINEVDRVTDEHGNNIGLKTCTYCQHNILQVVSCSFCGEIYLAGQAEWDNQDHPQNMIVRIPKVVDEVDIDNEDDDSNEEFASNTNIKNNNENSVFPVLLHSIPNDSKSYRTNWLEYLRKSDSTAILCTESSKIKDVGLLTYQECKNDIGRCSNCSMPFHIPSAMNSNGTFPTGKDSKISSFGLSSKILYSSLVKEVLIEDTEKDKNLPIGGRKLLGFTDSRQGTAYYAGMQGIVAEMAATRVWILNYLFNNNGYNRDKLIRKIENGIKKIGLAGFHLPLEIQKKKENSLAKLFLWREITFRSRRKRSLETLGLLQVNYEGLEEINRPTDVLQQFFASNEDYQNLLKIVLDYGFRAKGALELEGWEDPKDIQRAYAGFAVYIKLFDLSYFNPDEKPSRPNNIANIFQYYIEKYNDDPKNGVNWKMVCHLAQKAIRDLTEKEIIKEDEGLYKIDWTCIKLALPSKIWVCPSTKTLLDAVIYNAHLGEYFSPYVVSTAQWGKRLSIASNSTIDLTEVWNSEDKRNEFIQRFKDCSWWTDLHQDVLSSIDDNDAFVVSQEDTAQISSIQRAQDQKDFKEGKINILNCSTTMEMGVDIGDVSLVAMTNVPPHEYNYIQRAGRAGRAGQGQSFIWTISSFGGHERKAIKNPLQWVEKNSLKQKLNLENQRIVSRHFNAYMLAQWIHKQNEFKVDFEKKIYEFFIGQIEDDNWIHILEFLLRNDKSTKILDVDSFKALLEQAMQKSPMKSFLNSLHAINVDESLLSRTGCTKDSLMQQANEEWNSVYKNWEENVVNYYVAIIDGLEIGKYTSYDDIPLRNRAILRHLKKDLTAYGLGYLIKAGILPSNGMPIDVVTLESPNETDESEFPSRERKIAIREFAPGYSLIVDGERLISRGISLKPIPRTQSEDTLIRSYYTCQNCGTPYISGIDKIGEDREIKCSCCRNHIQGTPRKIVEPIGFKVLGSDRNLEYNSKPPFEQPHIKIENPQKILYKDISISYGSAWVVYLNGNTNAKNSNKSAGSAPNKAKHKKTIPCDSIDDGYCLCLNCGFVSSNKDAMELESEHSLHKAFAKANKKRGCKAENYRMVSLAAMNRTDAIILHIKQLKDPTSANTWALALRNALTTYLSLNQDEIGWSSQKGLEDVFDIVLYDNAAGGANLCIKIKDNLLTIFKMAKSLLDCPSGCDSICLDCLLTRETQVMAHVLNRNTALSKLDDKFFSNLEIPDNRKYWENNTQFHPDFYKLSHEIIQNTSEYSWINIFTGSNESSWSLSDWPLKYDIGQNKDKIRIVVPENVWERAKTDSFLKIQLMQIFQLTGTLYTTAEQPFVKTETSTANVFMEKIFHEDVYKYVVENLDENVSTSLEETFWDDPQKLSTFYGKSAIASKIEQKDISELFSNGLNAKTKQLPLNTQFKIDDFAEEIYATFKKDDMLLNQKVSLLKFSDRYLFTPSAIRVVCELIQYFNPENIQIVSSQKRDSFLKTRNINNAWACDYPSKHLEILEEALKEILPGKTINISGAGKAPHDRCMELSYDSGESRLIQFTGSPTIWEMNVSNSPKPETIHSTMADIDPKIEARKILGVHGCTVKLNEGTSIIVSK